MLVVDAGLGTPGMELVCKISLLECQSNTSLFRIRWLAGESLIKERGEEAYRFERTPDSLLNL